MDNYYTIIRIYSNNITIYYILKKKISSKLLHYPFFLLTRVIKINFFVILKFWYNRIQVQILQFFFHLFVISTIILIVSNIIICSTFISISNIEFLKILFVIVIKL